MNMKDKRFAAPARAHGFTMLEVLVAVIVLSFGLLGMVGLQAASIKANREARLQAVASRLAAELGDLMRNNRVVATKTTAAENPYLQANFSGVAYVAAASPDCYATACTSELQTAQADINDWLNRVASELPGAKVVVCFDTTPFDSSSGLARWSCTNTGNVVMVKLGWTRASTNRAALGAAAFLLATDDSLAPSLVLPIVSMVPGASS